MTNPDNTNDKNNKPNNPAQQGGLDHESDSKQKSNVADEDPCKCFKNIKVVFLFIFRLIKSGIDSLDKHSGAITGLATVAIAVLTHFLSVDANRQGNTLEGQLNAMQGQLTEMQASRRPWIKIFAEPISALTYDEQGNGQIKMNFVMVNVGTTPAVNVSLQPEIHPINNIGDTQSLLEKACDSIPKGPNPHGKLTIGKTLFPNDPFPYQIIMGIPRKEIEDNYKEWISKFRQDIGKESPVFTLIIVGCVTYKFPYSEEYHQTPFVYDVRKGMPDSPGRAFVFKLDESVPREQLLFELGVFTEPPT